MKNYWYIWKGKLMFWWFGRAQKEEAMRRQQTGEGGVISVGYLPNNAVELSGERKTSEKTFRSWWKENHHQLAGAAIKWHMANIRRLIKELPDKKK